MAKAALSRCQADVFLFLITKCVNFDIKRLLAALDPGGEVNFHAQNRRIQNEKELRFRLRHQDRFRGLLSAWSA
jgi:hypothetical protein